MQAEIQIQNTIIETIKSLFNCLPPEQKSILLKNLKPKVNRSKNIYKKELITSKNSTESYLFEGKTFEAISNALLEGKEIDWDKYKQTF